MMTAVERLGGRCYHMKAVLENTLNGRRDLHKWFRIAELEPFDEERLRLLEEIFEGYDVCADSPSCYVYEELMHLYPEAHVALTKRDASKWLDSVCATVMRPYRFVERPGVRVCMTVFDLLWRVPVIGVIAIIGKIAALPHSVALRPYLDDRGNVLDFYDPANHESIRARFDEYTRDVERTVPSDKLIVLQVPYDDAYRKVCPVLGVEVPEDERWPHVNDKVQLNRSLDVVIALLVIVPVALGLALLAMVYTVVTAPMLALYIAAGAVAMVLGVKTFLKLLVAATGKKDKNEA